MSAPLTLIPVCEELEAAKETSESGGEGEREEDEEMRR